ncbi:uncharacterized protein MONOS_13486 [Monocercomonoides exilis]|uniref:uncharacterized protein n=1 Tax=Monocercomonoides exilis TaxID=2049356 RepID=UPI003559A122|nr:hypothetical protein MONOS_13486 [Monocercomonoides exilis]|eukprot:MONOS_13486.1-p1 / transcript=MONOS_13486.1 / gene=MONOS_13486 / organism=Monocercomonoides_exilis_PA203 / gene_product=unspecified product / transcript_product=unspecified product / location=Mono_scaffold00835:25990-26496(+) / protein_length=169 / sequence_SO=supercontig / SO=protein_coding / is_pseudo=false
MDFVFVTRKSLQFCAMSCIKKLIAGVEAIQLYLYSAPSSSSTSSTGAARRSTSPFRRLRSEEKKVTGDDQPSSSSTPMIDPSDASALEALFTSARVMDDIERWLKCMKITIVVTEGATDAEGLCCGAKGGAVWRCCVCVRCGAFGDAYSSACASACKTYSIFVNEVAR